MRISGLGERRVFQVKGPAMCTNEQVSRGQAFISKSERVVGFILREIGHP